MLVAKATEDPDGNGSQDPYGLAPFGSEECNYPVYGEPGVHSEELPEGAFSLAEKGAADRSALV